MTDGRMTDTEALLWALEADPALRSAFVSVTFLDRLPDMARLRRRVADAVAVTPALDHRVAQASLDLLGPRWEPDPHFDLDFHLRHVAVPAPGLTRQVLDYAALVAADPLDHSRPLWQFSVVEGLADGQAALVAKMHHVLADGVGAVRMSASFLDLSPDGDAPAPRTQGAARGPEQPGPSRLAGAVATVVDTVRQPLNAPRYATESVALARSLVRQVAVVQPALSPLWSGHEHLAHRFEALSVGLDEVKRAAKALGGTVNDVLVTAVAAAAGTYHRARGVTVDELRMSMPVSTRTDRSVGGNAWAPTRVLVPVGALDAAERFAIVHARLEQTKHEPTLGLAGRLIGLGRALPAPLLVRLARQQTGTVDFACSNVRGAPFDLWIAGARVMANHPMGPTAGTAFNATVLSYRDQLDLGLNCDSGAVDDAGQLCELIATSFEELFSARG